MTSDPKLPLHDLLTPDMNKYIEAINKYGVNTLTSHLRSILLDNIELSSSVKARILAALWSTRNYSSFDAVFFDPSFEVSSTDVLKMVELLDAARKAKQVQTKIENPALSKKTKSKLKRKLAEYQSEELQLVHGTVTLALIKRIKKWTVKIPGKFLEHELIFFGTSGWKKLADICHFKSVDFQLNYFLDAVFDKPLPEDCFVAKARSLCAENLMVFLKGYDRFVDGSNDLLQSFPFYSMIRRHVQKGKFVLNQDHRVLIAKLLPLDQVIWYYEELKCSPVESILIRKLKGELQTSDGNIYYGDRMNYAVLMDRVWGFLCNKSKVTDAMIKYAESQLNTFNSLSCGLEEYNFAVLGDASGSMSVAIRVATIIGSLLSVSLKARLTFFDDRVMLPPVQRPSTVADVLKILSVIHERGGTSPAVSLLEYFNSKEKIDLFIMVTDEEENCKVTFNGQSMDFAQLFMEYRKSINPNARVFFVSFDQRKHPQMQTALKRMGVVCKSYSLNMRSPDLSKFNSLFGKLKMALLDSPAQPAPLYEELQKKAKIQDDGIFQKRSKKCTIL